jgi:site-specific recombinase XerD
MANKLYAAMKEKFLSSTSAGYMTKAKSLFQYAMDFGKIKINPCNGIKISKGTPTISYLSNDDISKIKALRLEDYDRLNKVRDLLLFQCSTGMAYCDLVQFDNNMVTEMNGVNTYTSNRQKTGIEFTTVILPMGMDVLKKYDGQLPLISNQKYNSYLKEIQRLAKINTTITTHICRKTYAHNMLNNGVRIETVARLLGHSNSNITQRIYCRQTSETIANEVAQIMGA